MKGLLMTVVISLSLSSAVLKKSDGIRSVHTATTTSVQKILDPENEGGGDSLRYLALGLTAIGAVMSMAGRSRK